MAADLFTECYACGNVAKAPPLQGATDMTDFTQAITHLRWQAKQCDQRAKRMAGPFYRHNDANRQGIKRNKAWAAEYRAAADALQANGLPDMFVKDNAANLAAANHHRREGGRA